MLRNILLKTLLIASVISWGLPVEIAAAKTAVTKIADKVLETNLEKNQPVTEVALRKAKKKRKWKAGPNKRHTYYKRYTYKKKVYRSRPRYRDPGRYIIPGIIIGGIIANEITRDYGALPRAHYNWCYARYRSYGAYDNTFQPYYGPRRQCISPYWP